MNKRLKTIDHVAIRSGNIDACKEWYEQEFGAICVFSTDFYHRMRFGNIYLAIIDKNKYPYNHIGVLIDNYEDLPTDGERHEHRDGTIGVYKQDPCGNWVEYIWYSDEAKEMLEKHESR